MSGIPRHYQLAVGNVQGSQKFISSPKSSASLRQHVQPV